MLHHVQNRKYITYCSVVSVEPRHVHGWRVKKFREVWTRGFWDMCERTDRHADYNTSHPVTSHSAISYTTVRVIDLCLFSAANNIAWGFLAFCNSELWPMTLTVAHDLHRLNMNQHATYLDSVIAPPPHTRAYNRQIALYWTTKIVSKKWATKLHNPYTAAVENLLSEYWHAM